MFNIFSIRFFTIMISITAILSVSCGQAKPTISKPLPQYKPNETSFLITTSKGTIIALDPKYFDNSIRSDIIIGTHSDHLDNFDQLYANYAVKNYQTQLFFQKIEETTVKDVHFYGIPSSLGKTLIDPSIPDNIIYVIEFDGFRIAAMGVCGQPELTAEQTAKIGKVDLAIMVIDDNFDGISVADAQKFISQIQPKTILTTYGSWENIQEVAKKTGKKAVQQMRTLEITKELITRNEIIQLLEK